MFCPFPDCATHRDQPFHYRRRGYFRRRCDQRRVARFLCSVCGRTFSTQRFRFDYRLKRPDLLVPFLTDRLTQVGHRESARIHACSRATEERHSRRLASLLAAFGPRALDAVRAGNRTVIRDASVVVAAPSAAPGLAPLLAPQLATGRAASSAGGSGAGATRRVPTGSTIDERPVRRRRARADQSGTPSSTSVRSRRSQTVSSESSPSSASRWRRASAARSSSERESRPTSTRRRSAGSSSAKRKAS